MSVIKIRINKRQKRFWLLAVIRFFLNAIQLVLIFLFFKVFGGSWLMFWLLLSLMSVSYADGYFKCFNKRIEFYQKELEKEKE
jgi:hypothetical protein